MRIHAAAALALLTIVATAAAQTGAELLIKPFPPQTRTWDSRAEALILPDGHTSNGHDFEMNIFRYAGRLREQPFVPRIGWDATYLDLHTSDPALAQDLVDISVGAAFELPEFGDWRGGFAVGVGYAGNSPFGEGDAWYGMATLRFGRRLSEKSELALVIDYDGNRTFMPDVPLPGFAWRHRHSPTLTYVVGIPVTSIHWRPDNAWRFNLTWTLVDRLSARVEYELSPSWLVFSELAVRSQGFSVDGLSDNDRLLFEQRRAEVGVQWRPWQHTRLVATAGYSFGTEFNVGFDRHDVDGAADISDEPYVRFGFERRF